MLCLNNLQLHVHVTHVTVYVIIHKLLIASVIMRCTYGLTLSQTIHNYLSHKISHATSLQNVVYATKSQAIGVKQKCTRQEKSKIRHSVESDVNFCKTKEAIIEGRSLSRRLNKRLLRMNMIDFFFIRM